MDEFTIEDFWKPRFLGISRVSQSLIRGWSHIEQGLATFVEAPLKISDEVEFSASANDSALILVSAPGAVGKSTLAKQISSICGAVYLDLAAADPVGGNTISGGIFKCGLSENWQNGNAAILIDGLDEARLRVTQEAYEAFLGDVADLAISRAVPTVLFGRTGAVQDAFLVFALRNVEVPILEIGYYDHEPAVEFSMARIRAVKPDRASEDTERKAVSGLIKGLSEQTNADGNRFAGYAPVLQAVADRVGQASNPQVLVSEIEKGAIPVSLEGITSAILDREHSKLNGLPFGDSSVADKLYRKDEQIHRLAARIYGVAPPEALTMAPKDAEIYDTALKAWVNEHPFLDGSARPSSAVFDAIISAWAMKNGDTLLSEKVLHRELGRGAAANPFFSEFYQPESDEDFPTAHVGVFYNSLRARLSLGDTAGLTIDVDEDAADENALRAEIEITLARRGEENPRVWNFDTDQTSNILLGPHVENVEISTPYATVDIGSGVEATFVSPVMIQCAKLQITSDRVIAESPVGSKDSSVFLEAEQFVGDRIVAVPTVRGDVHLSVSWPGSRAHPWTAFASGPTPVTDPREQEALRRFRKFIISFRSHSKGSLARFKDKIEHARMTKGVGQSVLDSLVENGVLYLEGPMYFLDPGVLTDKVGASYHDCVRRQYSRKTVDFIRSILNGTGTSLVANPIPSGTAPLDRPATFPPAPRRGEWP
ncbi:hypothetical protein [Roseospirillum parvum]|uniref:Uncharacterized protein n=1 Tax=Roseospirillum parvum TaxID=83401 RepID=A0A1G7TRW6_9PROT|nr:hypothetical protein [Roseospirillum parvum]SDG38045.1 hypothetical protein SAMN05421742_10185 [Roseospirillum parvum]